ncbi:MAG: PHP domain-containing protein, partial [Proteobacteria bacterium]|nr:PHP domain-containing protein [Pseudomonadota bacterium]
MDASIDFAELLVKTQYSFLEGASSPEEIVSTATTLGYSALGIVDNNGLYGAARTHVAAKKHRLPLIIGTEIEWKGSPLYLFAINHHGYGNLCEL